MPFVRAVFITGSLALAGIPILNGFWSKELVLEAGLQGGPPWAFFMMLVVAGLTAFYTYRMVWMVFFAGSSEPGTKHVHDAPQAMRVALAPLAFAAWTTWLLAGPFSWLLYETLPFHEIHPETTWAFVVEILSAPATWLALAVILVGLGAWHFRARLSWFARQLSGISRLAVQGFGFEDVNRWVVNTTINAAESLRQLQTGLLNWNLVGVIVGLIAVLVWLAWTI
jgi:NADH-quinone oxidoreductase subunit L